MLVSSSPTPIFTHLFGPDVEPGYRPIHLPKLHIVTVDEPPGGFDGGLIINTIQLNHADRQGFAISLPVGNWIVFYSFIVDTRSRLHMNVRSAPKAVALKSSLGKGRRIRRYDTMLAIERRGGRGGEGNRHACTSCRQSPTTLE